MGIVRDITASFVSGGVRVITTTVLAPLVPFLGTSVVDGAGKVTGKVVKDLLSSTDKENKNS